MFFCREFYKGIIKLNDELKELVNLKNDNNKFKESKSLDKT